MKKEKAIMYCLVNVCIMNSTQQRGAKFLGDGFHWKKCPVADETACNVYAVGWTAITSYIRKRKIK